MSLLDIIGQYMTGATHEELLEAEQRIKQHYLTDRTPMPETPTIVRRMPVTYGTVPTHTLRAVDDYVNRRVEGGDFLKAVLTNDLRGSFAQADSANLAAMGDIVGLVYNCVPSNCHGSPAAYEAWLAGRVPS